MLTSEAKRRIDGARQVLVGVLPNPMQQVEQITIALIYKFMDDIDEEARKLPNGRASFFVGELKEYSWHKLMDTKLTNQDKLNLYRDAAKKISESEKIPELFRSIFRNTYLPFNDPRTLGLFLSEINQFNYENSEELGNAYEYLLSIMGSQGDAGQFRTPRHIIDFIVKAIDPKKDDRILDPACGTAGFLISAYKHILEAHDGIDNKTGKPTDKETPLTSAERTKIHKNITGYDIDPNMVKTAKVNTYLHKFKDPNIKVYDTISKTDLWDEEFDVILANPPFMTPKGGIEPHSKFKSKANRTEVLFVDYILEHLSLKGRAGIIVPEGIIFQSANAYKALRKDLVEDGLYAVVSLPSGVFNPYSGVKTSILLFDKDITKKNKDILFIKINQDGYDLGAQRRETLDKNDLPLALEILKEWKEKQTVKENQNIAFTVSKSEIAESGDYNLTGERYREVVDYSNVDYEIVELKNIANIRMGETLIKKDLTGSGKAIFSADTSDEPWNFTEKTKLSFERNTLVVGARGTIGSVKMPDLDEFTCTQTTIAITLDNQKVFTKYIFHLLRQLDFKNITEGMGIPMITVKNVEKIKIPLPPLEVQKQIVEELDSYQKVIDGAKQVVENWKPNIKIESDWEMVELGNEKCFKIESGGTPSSKVEEYWNGEIKWATLADLPAKDLITDLSDTKRKITKIGLQKSSTKLLPQKTILISSRATIGRIAITQIELATNQGFKNLIIKDFFKINEKFVALMLARIVNKMKQLASGGTFKEISKTAISTLKIPLPPLEVQRQIVAEIEAEQKIVDQNKKLIEIFEEKIKRKIIEIWGE